MLLVFHSILSFAPDNNPLSTDDSEEGGIFLRQEVIKTLEKFREDTLELKKNLNVKTFHTESKYDPEQILKTQQFSCPNNLKKPVSTRQLFVYLLAHLDILSTAYSFVGVSSLKMEMLNIYYLVEATPNTFDNLILLIEKLIKIKESPKDEARIYSILAVLRLLKLNIETLTLWKRKDESKNSLAMRTVHGKVTWEGENNFFQKVKDYLTNLLEEEGKSLKEEKKEEIKEQKEEILEVKREDNEEKITLKNKKETTKEQPLIKEDIKHDFEDDDFIIISNNNLPDTNLISIEISSIFAIGFSLFYSDEDQKSFILDALKNITNPLKYKILKQIIERTLKDQNYFESFWIKEFLFNKKSLVFIEKVIGFLKNYTSFNLVLDKLKISDTHIMILNLLRILLKWQNNLFSKIQLKNIQDSIEGEFLLNYSKILLSSYTEILNEALSIKDQDPKHIDLVLGDSLGGYLVFPLIQSLIQITWNKDFSTNVSKIISKELSYYFPIILKNIHKLNITKPQKSDWYLVESFFPTGGSDKVAQKDYQKDNENILGTSFYFHKKSNPKKMEIYNNNLPNEKPFIPKSDSIVFTTGTNISISVNGDENQFKFKSGIFPVYSDHWLTELEKDIGWLASRFACNSFNESDEETNIEGLSNPLLVNGLLKEEKIDSFLLEMIEEKNEASKMIDFMYKHLKNETPQTTNQFLIITERTILITLLYHSGLITNFLSMIENINQEKFIPPNEFISIWRKARQIRPWIAQMKQQNENIEFKSIQEIISKRCDFLLSFNPSGLDYGTVNMEVFNFITNDNIDVLSLRKTIKNRKIKATNRAEGLLLFNELLDSTKNLGVKSIILYSLNQAIRTKALNFHFLNNISHVGQQIYQEIFDLTFKLYEKIISDLSNPEEVLYLDGFLKEVINSFLLNFKAIDIQWITDLDLIKKITPFIFIDYKRDDNFYVKSFLPDEMISISLKSLAILKILSLRVTDILENWDNEKNNISNEKQEKIEGLLKQCLQSIFDLFFKEFEKIKKNQTNIVILCEILGLLCILSTTTFFQEKLKSEEFLEILSNILSINNPKVMEYCLELSGKIISNGEKTNGKVKLFSQLLEYFGAQQMTYALGKNIFKIATVSKKISKNVFSLIRKTIEDEEWNQTFVSILSDSLNDSIEKMKKGMMNQVDVLKPIYAGFVILNGIKLIPQQGETVDVNLANRKEESKVYSIEDNILNIRLEKLTKITQTYRVPIENIKTNSDECKPLKLKEPGILFEFLETVYQQQKDSKIELEKLIFSILKLEMIKVLKENKFYGKIELFEKIALEPTDKTYGLEQKLSSCTICSTGEQFHRQSYYSCITCGMEKSKACCVFCAKTCHKGHNLAKVEVGDFYCDCGANSTKKKCEALGKQESNSKMSKKRMEYLLKTLETLLPISKIETKTNQNLYRKFNFKNGYFEKDGLISNDKSTFSMLDTSILDLTEDFYFEIIIEKLGIKDTICIGFTEKVNENKVWPDVLDKSITLNCLTGNLFRGPTIFRVQFIQGNTKVGDVFGLGYEEKEKHIYFTKNGQRINGNFPIQKADYYPFIILRGELPLVKVNFGLTPFEYKIIQFNQVNKKISELIQLMELGFKENDCVEALNKYPNDINAAMVWLSNLTIKPVRYQLADQLQSMGFKREQCLTALKLKNDDLEEALQLLLEGNIEKLGIENEKSFIEDKGISLIGSDVSKVEIDNLTYKAMFINPNAKLNDEFFTSITLSELKMNDIITLNPNLASNHPLYLYRGQICVYVGPYKGGATIYIDDRKEEKRFYSNVMEKDISTFTPKLNMKDLTSTVTNLYNQISILESREILYNTLMNQDVDIMPSSLFRILKSIFVDQYDEQENTFINSDYQLLPKYQRLIEKLKLKKIRNIPMMDYLSQEAIKEIVQFTETKPHYRKIIFKSEYINSPQLVKFFNATNLYIHFLRCDLPTQGETFTISYDKLMKSIVKQFKGSLVLQKSFVVSGGQFYFEFKGNMREGSGFQFFVTPYNSCIPEEYALLQPNIILSSTILQNTSSDFLKLKSIKSVYEYLLNYLMLPLAPFKGSIINTLTHITNSETIDHKTSLNLLKDLRFELEELYQLFSKYYESSPHPFPNFHRFIDYFSILRKYLKTDLCKTILPNPSKKNHFYYSKKRDKCCTSCSIICESNLKYLDQEIGKCELSSSTKFQPYSNDTTSNLIPLEKIQINPSDWFEHTSWIDQITITRQLIESLIQNKLPEWAIYEAALETKKKVIYKSSPHPYSIVKDSGEIKIPQANNLFISFDKHSKTHKCDKLIFYGKSNEEIGRFSGDELKDKTILIHGNTVSYVFKSIGGDHENTCNSCGVKISGIRFRCTECDDYDLCDSCMKKPRIHNETHLMLKIRRPVDCVPAALHHLYTIKWTEGYQFRGNIHVNVKCNGCGMMPIRGLRYWCENCEDYNLCEKCGEDEYLFHDRMHIFLRVIRPLPPKNERPSNHLPYGLVYEKELDTHWGYLFSVSSSESSIHSDDPIIKEVQESIKGFTTEADSQLIDYIENHCNGWQALEWNGLNIIQKELSHYPKLNDFSLQSLRYRFIVLKLLNRKISKIIHLLDVSSKEKTSLGGLIANIREKIFKSVKMDVWVHSITKSLVETTPIPLLLSRQKEDITPKNTLFLQTFSQLESKNVRFLSRKNGAWKVTFVGESADDYGGPFRESLTSMCLELESDLMDLMIPVPNSKVNGGMNGEKFIPNPNSNINPHLRFYHFLGKILAVGLLNNNILPFDLPSLFWKRIVDENVNLNDLKQIDTDFTNSLEKLIDIDQEGIDAESFEDIIFNTFICQGSDGLNCELIKNGKNIKVTFENRKEFVNKSFEFRLNESKEQIELIKKGLFSILPQRYFSILKWNELELLICGSPNIDLNILKKHTIYDGYSQNSIEIINFWSVLEEFTQLERSNYLKFVWGRARLPITNDGFTHPMKIQKLNKKNPDRYLPLSHTCFFSIELPQYSSKKVMKEKLLYAITHCKAIDIDVTNSANESRNMNIQ